MEAKRRKYRFKLQAHGSNRVYYSDPMLLWDAEVAPIVMKEMQGPLGAHIKEIQVDRSDLYALGPGETEAWQTV